MENITLAVVVGCVITCAAFLKAVLYLQDQMKNATKKMLADEFAEMNRKIDGLQADVNKRLDDLYGMQEEAAIEACKNFLTHALVDIENGANDEVLKRRIHSAHTWYNNHHQNSYIDTKFNKLVDEGKL